MSSQTENQPSRSAGFIREALREFSRKSERRKLRRQLQQREAEKGTALVALGQSAWQQQIDLSGFAEFRDRIGQLDRQAGELSARLQALDASKAGLEARQREETAKFDAQHQGVEQQKAPVDAALRGAQQNQAGGERAVQQSAARLSKVVAELAALEQQAAALAAAPPSPQPNQMAAVQARREQLAAERAALTGQVEQWQTALPGLKAEVDRLTQESGRFQAEIDRIEAERRAVLAPILAEMKRVSGETASVRQQATATSGEQTEQFRQLGLALFSKGSTEPALAPLMEQTASASSAGFATQQALDSSLSLTRAMPRGTMWKFWTVAVVVPVLIVAAAVGGYAGWSWWRERSYVEKFDSSRPINPYLSQPLAGLAPYSLANRLASARGEQQVANLMLEAFRALHLGVYTYDGRQIQAGAEHSEKDFFLYDFQWKTIAHAYYSHSLMNFSQNSALWGAAAGMDNPTQLEPNLAKAIRARYQQASQSPNDPNSYLILLVDGLARNQLKPYTLSELGERPAEDLYIDPLQGLLIMLDFFLADQNSAPATSSWLRWSLVPSVHAQSPCDAIQGDQGQKYWGYGVTIGGLGLSTLGKGNQIAGAAGDLLMLYGITIKITPTNYTFHLRHDDEDYIYGFTAKVTFDPQGVPDEAIKCGWLAGKMMPKSEEGLKDVELTWDIKPVWPPYLIVPHEIVQRLTGHLGFQTKTDAVGESDFGVQPTDCPNQKGGGGIVGRDLMMTATARVLTNKIPTPTTLGWISLLTKLGPGGLEYLMNGRTGYCLFRVEWHDKKPAQKHR
jgi:predicted  nucleic acid-binding Zn-ribbon protein